MSRNIKAIYLVSLATSTSTAVHAFTLNLFPASTDGHKIGWPHLIITSFCTSLPFNLIAACLRFDNANSVPPVALPDSSVDPLDNSVVITEDDRTKVIVTQPTRKGFDFHKPYFLTGMLGYLLSALVLATVTVLGKTEFSPIMSGFFLGYLSPVVITVMIGLVAVVRKDSGKLWAYREDWYIKPRPQTDVESGCSTVYEVRVNENEKGEGFVGCEEKSFVKLNV